jgi:ArsR family transcriptional regulator
MKTASRTQAATRSVTRAFRAVSDRTRLRILHLLLPGELCVCDLVAVLRLSQPMVSRHLAYLRRAGLVECRRDGPWCHYRLAAPRTPFAAALYECLAASAQELPELARDAQRRPTACRRGCC